MAEEGWRAKARCRGKTWLFFDDDPESVERAKAQCRMCPVLGDCRREVKQNPPKWGVWAGELFEPPRRQRRRTT